MRVLCEKEKKIFRFKTKNNWIQPLRFHFSNTFYEIQPRGINIALRKQIIEANFTNSQFIKYGFIKAPEARAPARIDGERNIF